MALSVEIDTTDVAITPLFKYEMIEDIPASEREGRLVLKPMEVVEVHFAGRKLYAPVFPAAATWRTEGHKVITYAERWADQYRAFLDGNAQRAAGTPLEMLSPYGITPAQLSLCRALKIYSIEALHSLEGDGAKSLQMQAAPLKKIAAAYMADRAKGDQSASQIEKLMAEIEALKKAIPPLATPEQVDEAIQVANDEFIAMSNDELKEFIGEKTGEGKPRGNPSRDTLLSMARELAA